MLTLACLAREGTGKGARIGRSWAQPAAEASLEEEGMGDQAAQGEQMPAQEAATGRPSGVESRPSRGCSSSWASELQRC